MYAAIRRGKAKAGSIEELIQRVEAEAAPMVSRMAGFKAYYMVVGEDDSITTISIFESQATAEESNQQMLGWIKQNVAPLLAGPPEGMAGKVVVHRAG